MALQHHIALLGWFLISCLIPAYGWTAQQHSWMVDQIQADLAPFAQNGIDRSKVCRIGQTCDPEHQIILVRLQGGKAHLSTRMALTPHTQPRIQIIQAFFDRLGQKVFLPDVDFLLSVHDGFNMELGVPVFSFAKRATSQSILMPDFEALSQANDLIRSCKDASRAHPWHTKQSIIFWRGSTTGGIYRLDNYFELPRAKLVFLSAENPTWLDAAFTSFCQGSPEVFALIEQNGRPLAPFLAMGDHFAYKYLIDIDGNSCTYSRCRWILLSNSTLIKPSSPNIQWYYKALVPWVHYVPVKEDLSDLFNVFAWLIAHDNQAQMIAEQGQQLGHVIFSEEAIDYYMLLLLRAYNKLQK